MTMKLFWQCDIFCFSFYSIAYKVMVTRSYYRILFYLYCHSSTYFSLTLLRHSQTCICAIEVWGVKKQHALISKCLWIIKWKTKNITLSEQFHSHGNILLTHIYIYMISHFLGMVKIKSGGVTLVLWAQISYSEISIN
jgi:hypothetical protein